MVLSYGCSSSVFFFQAEDGIRDVAVTGVQTCALPIFGSTSLLQRRMSVGYGRAARIIDQLELAGILGPANGSKARGGVVGLGEVGEICGREETSAGRSGGRRGGKEGRSRWAPYHLKKK